MSKFIKDSVYQSIRIFAIVAGKILFRYEVKGSEHIPMNGAAIIAANHASYLDPPFIGMGIKRPIYYVAKKELFHGIFGAVISYVNAIPVNRDQLDKKTLKTIMDILHRGEIILMFPEGTRAVNGELQKGKTGVGFIAYHAKVPVIPAYINGSHDILPRHKKMIRLRKCTVSFGPPMVINQMHKTKKAKDLYSRISRQIMEGIHRMRN